MGNLTLAVPEHLHKRMHQHPELKWSEIARQAFEAKLSEAEIEERILAKTRLTEADAERIGRKVKQEIARRHGLIQ